MPNALTPEPELDSEREPGANALEQARGAAQGHDKQRYVQGMFSDIAPRYDLLNHVLSMNVDKAWRRKALTALQWELRPGGTFLDLCAGTLDVGAALSKRPGFDGFVVGADFAFPMLQHGKGKAPRAVLQPVTADAQVLPFPSQSMDGCIVAFGIRNVAKLERGLAEVFRVLKPGARFVILEFSTPPVAIVRWLYHAYFHYGLPLIGRIVSGHKSAYTYLPLSVSSFPAGAELAEALQRAGFSDVSWQSLTFGIAAIHVGRVPMSQVSVPSVAKAAGSAAAGSAATVSAATVSAATVSPAAVSAHVAAADQLSGRS